MAKILITGIDGFTGLHLARALVDRGDEVHGLVRQASDWPALTVHECDLQNSERLCEIVAEVKPSKVVHLAAISFVAHADVDEIYRTNLLGTRHLLGALWQAGMSLDAVLLASSANIYGNSQLGVIDENVAPSPANDYAVSKIAMEHMARLFQDRLPIIIARPFNYTGVGQSKNFLIPKMIDCITRRAKTIELGNIDIERDWSDVRDVAEAYIRLLEADAAIGQTVNVCSGLAHNLRGVLELACEIADHEMEVCVNPAFVRANEVRSLRGSTDRLETLIGPLKHYALEETLRWMLTAG